MASFGGVAVFVVVLIALLTGLLIAVGLIWRRRRQLEDAKVLTCDSLSTEPLAFHFWFLTVPCYEIVMCLRPQYREPDYYPLSEQMNAPLLDTRQALYTENR